MVFYGINATYLHRMMFRCIRNVILYVVPLILLSVIITSRMLSIMGRA